MRQLGWDHIDAVFIAGDEIDCELAEIAENLLRVDLSKEQRDAHIRRYAELLEAREARERAEQEAKEVSGQVVQKLPVNPQGGRPKETAAKVAEKTGLSQRTVRRALSTRPVDPEAARERKEAEQRRREQGRPQRRSSRVTCFRLLKNAEIAEAIQAAQQNRSMRAEIDAARVLYELGRLALYDRADIAAIPMEGPPRSTLPPWRLQRQ